MKEHDVASHVGNKLLPSPGFEHFQAQVRNSDIEKQVSKINHVQQVRYDSYDIPIDKEPIPIKMKVKENPYQKITGSQDSGSFTFPKAGTQNPLDVAMAMPQVKKLDFENRS